MSSIEYPADMAGDVTTREGTSLHLRPIRPDDAVGLLEFHGRLSQRSVYRRFLFVHPKLSASEVDRFTHVDYADRLALVVEDGDRLVAVGRYDRSPGTSEAEVAFVVADEYQHHGIGTMLLHRLAEAAGPKGITTFTACTLADNRDMLDVFVHGGFPVTRTYEDGTVNVRMSIGSGGGGPPA